MQKRICSSYLTFIIVLSTFCVNASDLTFSECKQHFKKGSQKEKLVAIENLEKLGTDDAVKFLIKIAKKGDLEVRKKAIFSLGCIENSGTIQPLLDLFTDDNREIRKAAEVGSAKKGDQVVNKLIAMLTSTKTRKRISARNTLLKIGAPAIETLVPCIFDKNQLLFWTATDILIEIGDERIIEPFMKRLGHYIDDRVRRENMQNRLKSLGVPYVDVLIASIPGLFVTAFDTKELRVHVLKLGTIDDPKAVSTLIDILKSNFPDVQIAVIRSLVKFGAKDPRTVPVLVDILKNSRHHNVVEVAIRSLVKIGANESSIYIAPIINKPYRNPNSITPGKTNKLTVHLEAVKAVVAFKDSNAINELKYRVDYEINRICEEGETVGPSFEDVLAVIALGQFDTPEISEFIMSVLKRCNYPNATLFTEAALKMLGTIREKKAIEEVKKYLSHKDPLVKKAAEEFLVKTSEQHNSDKIQQEKEDLYKFYLTLYYRVDPDNRRWN